jgi:hypothetical protein
VRDLVESCTDEVLPGDCNNFDVSRSQWVGGIANSKYPRGYYATSVFDFTLDSITGDWAQCFSEITSYPGQLSDAAYATTTVARTNPSRPYVDIPANVLELGQFTKLLHEIGDDIIKDVADTNLYIQFGIMPLLRDLTKLMTFNDQVHRRIKEIRKLQSPRGLRRTIPLDSLSASVKRNNVYLQTGGFIATRTFEGIGRRQIKGHARWKAGGNLDKIDQQEMCNLAKRTLLGGTIDFATLWQAMPWSWLIDWGTNIGEYLYSQRNIIPADLIGVWLMKHTTTQYTIPAFETADERITAIGVLKERKSRERGFVTPTAHFPFLNGNQMGIIASLSVPRLKYFRAQRPWIQAL